MSELLLPNRNVLRVTPLYQGEKFGLTLISSKGKSGDYKLLSRQDLSDLISQFKQAEKALQESKHLHTGVCYFQWAHTSGSSVLVIVRPMTQKCVFHFLTLGPCGGLDKMRRFSTEDAFEVRAIREFLQEQLTS